MPRASHRHQETYNGVKIDLSADDPKVLAQKVRQRQNEIDAGQISIDANMTVSRWADTWAETYKKNQITDKNYKTYVCNLKKITSVIGHIKIKDVRPHHLQEIINQYAGKSRSHLQHIKNSMTGMFGRAKRNNMIINDPSIDIELPKTVTKKRRSLTDSERGLMLAACENHYSKTLIYIMLYAGLRPNECAALRWEHINLDRRLINVQIAQESGTRIEKSTKTDAGVRKIPINPPLYNHLTNIAQPSGYVLSTSTGRSCTVDTFEAWWKYLKRKMDILAGATIKRNKIIVSKLDPDLKLYMLRHTFCTDLQRAGIPLNIAKELMGHEDVAVTANIYTEYTEDQFEETARKMSEFIEQRNNGM